MSARAWKSVWPARSRPRTRRSFRRALGACVPDGIQNLPDLRHRGVRREARRRICRAMSTAWSRAWGSARSLAQPCSSHSWMAWASCSTDIAQPRCVRIPRFRLLLSILTPPEWMNPSKRISFRLTEKANTRQPPVLIDHHEDVRCQAQADAVVRTHRVRSFLPISATGKCPR